MAELSEQQEQDLGETKQARRSRSGFWFGVIILLIIIGLAGAGFYLFTQLRDQQKGLGGEVKGQMSKQIADYQSQLAAIQSQLATLEANIAGKDTHFNKTLADFSQLHNEKLESTRKELNEAIARVQRQLGKTRGDWLIADAEYLLSVANERLHLIGDVNTTREALEAADQRLRESGDAGTFKVREEIAREIADIKSVIVPDIVGIYASIQSMQDRVDKLVLFLPYTGKTLTAPAEEKKQSNEDKEAHDLLDSAMNQLEGIVTIRHTEHPIKEILTPEEAQFIREQLRVKLEMVKISLVQHNEALFQSSLADAKKWTEQNFTKNTDVNNFIAELDRFNTIKIRSQFPDISSSLKMLRDITKLRIETDKAMQPEENVAPIETVNPVESKRPAEAVNPAESTKPAETMNPAEAVPATQ
ncbi:MAG: uroporphyrinogen-III C-methyltransferase [Methylococcaceae bacterium]|nr:uroporphyrinogen-III C-methyltransferase [Methylococcaceae bacterium]